MCLAQSSVFDLRKSPLGSANMVAKKEKRKEKRKKKKILHIMGQIIHNPDLISYNAAAILKLINGFARIMNIEKPVTKHPPICLLALCEEDQEAVAPNIHHGAY